MIITCLLEDKKSVGKEPIVEGCSAYLWVDPFENLNVFNARARAHAYTHIYAFICRCILFMLVFEEIYTEINN